MWLRRLKYIPMIINPISTIEIKFCSPEAEGRSTKKQLLTVALVDTFYCKFNFCCNLPYIFITLKTMVANPIYFYEPVGIYFVFNFNTENTQGFFPSSNCRYESRLVIFLPQKSLNLLKLYHNYNLVEFARICKKFKFITYCSIRSQN